jgi:hypothetical protein
MEEMTAAKLEGLPIPISSSFRIKLVLVQRHRVFAACEGFRRT